MTDHAIMLVGGPDSGKTNYLARLWEAIRAGNGALFAPRAPTDIKYVEGALAHLLQGAFAPRSDKTLEAASQSFSIPVVLASNISMPPVNVMVPDVSGELWKRAVETYELPANWMEDLQSSSGALLFVRVGSDQNVEPLDWVNSAKFLRMTMMEGEAGEERSIPTQVALCEMLRFLDYGLKKPENGRKRRVAMLVTAWDRLDSQLAQAGPLNYLQTEYPLFAGYLADVDGLEIKVFGTSVVGGDFIEPEFKKDFLGRELNSTGYVLHSTAHGIQRSDDLTLPVAWAVEGLQSTS